MGGGGGVQGTERQAASTHRRSAAHKSPCNVILFSIEVPGQRYLAEKRREEKKRENLEGAGSKNNPGPELGKLLRGALPCPGG